MKLASLALICSAASADESASTGKVTAEFIGASGGIKIFPKSDANGFTWCSSPKQLVPIIYEGTNCFFKEERKEKSAVE